MNLQHVIQKYHLRALVTCTIITSIITQFLMQTGGGPRENQFDLSDAFEPFIDEFIFTGLPPFISSGGVFAPEIYVFQIGFTVSGILILWLVIRLHGKNGVLSFDGSKSRVFSAISGTIVGLSLTSIVHFSWIEDPLIHSYFAGAIFSGALVWLGSVHIATQMFEDNAPIFGIEESKLRTYSLGVAILCWLIMPIPLYLMKLQFAALIEWAMMLSLQFGLLSLESILETHTKK